MVRLRFGLLLLIAPSIFACKKSQVPALRPADPTPLEIAAAPPSRDTRESTPSWPMLPPPPRKGGLVREEKHLVVDGVSETWRIEWREDPRLDCVDESWWTCPCHGHGFGEVGKADLVRLRPGAPEDRFDLGAISEELSLQRWVPPKSLKWGDPPPTLEEMEKLPVADVMDFADYDHDGRATELTLYASNVVCGHITTVVVGISKTNPKLHVFEADGEHLTLQSKRDWAKVRDGLPARIVTWACGDHGSAREESMFITRDARGFHVKKSERACPGP